MIFERILPNDNGGRLWTLERMRDVMMESAADPAVIAVCRHLQTPRVFWKWWEIVWVHAPDETDQTIKWPRVMLTELRRHGKIAVACAGAAMMYGTCGVVNRGRVNIVGIAQTAHEILDHVWATWNGVPYDPIMGAAVGLPPGQAYPTFTLRMTVPVSVAPWQGAGS